MAITEEKLLASGFTPADMRKINNNLASYGGTLSEAIHDLANRFRIVMWVTTGCFAVFLLLMVYGSAESIFSGSIGLFCGVLIVLFVQPPLLAYKSWKYRNKQNN